MSLRKEWVEAPGWRLATDAEASTRRCRWSVADPCRHRVAAALNRGRSTRAGRVDQWWFYCEEHMFGRRIGDGRVEEQVFVEAVGS